MVEDSVKLLKSMRPEFSGGTGDRMVGNTWGPRKSEPRTAVWFGAFDSSTPTKPH